MREIKFRGWDKEKKKMYRIQKALFGSAGEGLFCVDGISFKKDCSVDGVQSMNVCDDDCKEKTPHCELMQFTGLTDKNGKEIYENDIVKYVGWDRKEHIGLVEYNKEKCAFVLVVEENLGHSTANENDEVIGNIHENPELLAN